MKRGVVVFNKFYFDDGMKYMSERLLDEFSFLGIELKPIKTFANFGFLDEDLKGIDFAIFFDKDMPLAAYLERNGVRVFNSYKTLCTCDDKELTYSRLVDFEGITLADTILAPLMYDVNDDDGEELLKLVAKKIRYPIVVKEAVGSQGRQVFLAESYEQLKQLYSKLKYKKHLYQEFLGDKRGEDIRVYVVAKKAVGAARRTNTTDFRSNVSVGGVMEIIELDDKLKATAERAANALDLEYGSVDFILDNKKGLVLIEVNSNVYFRTCESKGLMLAKMLAEYVKSEING